MTHVWDMDARERLRVAEVRAEQIVAVMRMAVSLSLAAAVVITMQGLWGTPDRGSQYWWLRATTMLSSYFLLGLGSWIICRTGHFRPWMAWPAAAADSAFFLITIQMSLAEFKMPGDYIFAIPSVWLVMLILAFGVLRFNPALQAFIAVITVVGLAMIVTVGDMAGPSSISPMAAPTARFMAPTGSGMRLSILGLAGLVLVVATWRARALLRRSITEAQHSANLTRYLPEQLAGKLAEGGLEALRRGRQGDMGVLFIDVRGFTRWSQDRSPQEVSELMTAFRIRVTRVVRRHGGIIDKFIGDAAMILFDPGNDPRGVARASQASLDCVEGLCREAADWSRERLAAGLPPVGVGIGLHWGQVFSGVVGDDYRLEYTVFGDTVNIAARLEALTRSLDMEAIASHAVLERIAGPGAAATLPAGWRQLDPVPVRGRTGTIAIIGRPLPENMLSGDETAGTAPDQHPDQCTDQ